MSVDWFPGVRAFCAHWGHAPMLQETLKTLEHEFANDRDACIDAAKAIVECSCRVIIDNLDDPTTPHRPPEDNPPFGKWVSAAVRVLKLGDTRDNDFNKLISQYHKLTTTLGDLRNSAGTVSHGRDGFISKLSTHQRRAALLAADAIVAFLHEAYLEHDPDPVQSQEPYDYFERSNDLIDRHVAVVSVDLDGEVPEIVFQLPNGDEWPLQIEPSRLLFATDREAYKAALLASRVADEAGSPEDENGEAA